MPPRQCTGDRISDEFDLGDAAENVASVLPNASIAAISGEVGEIISVLQAHCPDVVFNACEAPRGRPDLEPHAAALFEWLGVPFTGSGSATLALCRRKDRCNAVLVAQGVPVPRTGVFPCIVKPADEDGSTGISEDSVCDDAAALSDARSRWPGPVIVQEFLPGREFAVALWGRDEPCFVAIGENRLTNGLRLITYNAKWNVSSAVFSNYNIDYPKDLDPSLRDRLVDIARGAWRALELRGYGRVDIRLSAGGDPFVLDVNPNPELGPGVGICRAVEESGWTWEAFVRQQVEWAYDRQTTYA